MPRLGRTQQLPSASLTVVEAFVQNMFGDTKDFKYHCEKLHHCREKSPNIREDRILFSFSILLKAIN